MDIDQLALSEVIRSVALLFLNGIQYVKVLYTAHTVWIFSRSVLKFLTSAFSDF